MLNLRTGLLCGLMIALATPLTLYADQHVSVCGTVFTQDNSDVLLTQAYRDPNGLVWGIGSTEEEMDQPAAAAYCSKLNARLPTQEEFETLAKFLCLNAIPDYSLFRQDDMTSPVIPGMDQSDYYWAAMGTSDSPDDSGDGAEYSALDGYMGVTSSGNVDGVVCVANPASR